MSFGFGKSELPTEQPDLGDIFGKTGNGTLDFSIAKSTDWRNSKARGLNVSIWTSDFDAIYASALKSIGLEPVDTSGQYNSENFDKNLQRFVSEFPQFPVVTMYQDMYQDYILGPNEISSLLNECRVLQQIELTYDADLALRKLIYGCEEAIRDDGYLIFICD